MWAFHSRVGTSTKANTMEGMLRNRIFRLGVLLAPAVVLIWPLTAGAQNTRYRGRKFKPPPPTARIVVTVLRQDNDTPIPGAHVIFHPVEGEKDKGGMELKTNDEGVTVMTVIPIGDTILLQVISKGYQTYGGRYQIDKADESMHIRMKLPGQQYSIYDNRMDGDVGNGSGGSSQGSGNDKPESPKN